MYKKHMSYKTAEPVAKLGKDYILCANCNGVITDHEIVRRAAYKYATQGTQYVCANCDKKDAINKQLQQSKSFDDLTVELRKLWS